MTFVSCHDEALWQRLFGSESSIRPDETAGGDSRIVGGETSPEHYSYQVSFQLQTKSGGGIFFFFQQPQTNWWVVVALTEKDF